MAWEQAFAQFQSNYFLRVLDVDCIAAALFWSAATALVLAKVFLRELIFSQKRA